MFENVNTNTNTTSNTNTFWGWQKIICLIFPQLPLFARRIRGKRQGRGTHLSRIFRIWYLKFERQGRGAHLCCQHCHYSHLEKICHLDFRFVHTMNSEHMYTTWTHVHTMSTWPHHGHMYIVHTMNTFTHQEHMDTPWTQLYSHGIKKRLFLPYSRGRI